MAKSSSTKYKVQTICNILCGDHDGAKNSRQRDVGALRRSGVKIVKKNAKVVKKLSKLSTKKVNICESC